MVSRNDDGRKRAAMVPFFSMAAILAVLIAAVGACRQGEFSTASSTAGAASQTASAPVSGSSSAAPAASDAAGIQVEQGFVRFYFASGKADLASGAGEALADLVKGAQAGRKLAISGFHDASGNAERNADLARKRALAVRDALIRAGVAESQIELKKPGQASTSGSDAEARRVEITLQ